MSFKERVKSALAVLKSSYLQREQSIDALAEEWRTQQKAYLKLLPQREDKAADKDNEEKEVAAKMEIAAVFDIAFRSLTDDLIRRRYAKKLAFEESKLSEVFQLSILWAASELGSGNRDLPFRLLDDMLEGHTISHCERLWDLIESRRDELTTPTFVPLDKKVTRSSLALLKMCNGLLRKLSKGQNAVFCGRILMFLAYTFSLSERSAVNLSGQSNVNNATDFESEPEFLAGEADEVQNSSVSQNMEGIDGEAAEKKTLDFAFYKTFWGVQRFLSRPNSAVENMDSWKDLLHGLDTVLSAFHAHPLSSGDLENNSTDDDMNTQDDHGTEVFLQTKYLTNSRLLKLQLRDPILRQNVLTQIATHPLDKFLILIRHLSTVKITLNPSPKSVLPEYEKKVLEQLKKTPPHGKEYQGLVQHSLERERNWTRWKADKCPPFERFPDPAAAKVEGKGGSGGAKRLTGFKRPLSAVDRNGEPELEIVLGRKEASSNLEILKDDARAHIPQLNEYLETFIDALDPANEIEPEYHPRNDKIYCWRAMRLMTSSKLQVFESASEGIEDMVQWVHTGEKPPKKAKEESQKPPSQPSKATQGTEEGEQAAAT